MESPKENLNYFKNYEPRLNQEWVQVLIELRMKHAKLFTRKRNSAAEAWKTIIKEMGELGAPDYVTLDKIKKKWMNLMARYKQLKFSMKTESITWPYYELIDTAYSKNPSIVDVKRYAVVKKDSDSEESGVSDYAEYMLKKQKFTNTLIQLRYAYRHLFTGKKYAALRGWMEIKNLLPNGENYTVDQISKCWQNLIQRYRHLIGAEKDRAKITWAHFDSMHEIMTKREDPPTTADDENVKAERRSPEKVVRECEDAVSSPPQKRKRPTITTLADLLEHLVERDRRTDEFRREVLATLAGIERRLEGK